MNNILKASCLAIYLLAIVAIAGALPHGIASVLQLVAVLLLAGHVLELLVAFSAIKRYPGLLIDSIGVVRDGGAEPCQVHRLVVATLIHMRGVV